MTLEQELQALVEANWGLVFELYAKAEELRVALLGGLRAELDRQGYAVESDAREVWVSVGDHAKKPYVAIRPLTDSPRPAARVYTAFRPRSGGGYAQVKAKVPAELRRQFGSAWDGSGQRSTVVDVLVEEAEVERLRERVLEALARQVPVAEALD